MNERILENFDFTPYFNTKEPIILALSGGVDSMVLFDILTKQNHNLIIAHVHHHKRPESDYEYIMLKSLASEKSIPFEGFKITEDILGNFQEEARNIRLNFFKDCAKKHQTNFVILAHHLDDQIESFFMRLIKGSPLQNLSGMKKVTPYDDIFLIRPFLDIPKETLVSYANKHHVKYYEDTSNQDSLYTRNRFRNILIPKMSQENPKFYEAMLEHITSLSHLESLIDTPAHSFINKKGQTIHVEDFLLLNPLIQKEVITLLIKQHTPKSYQISKHLIALILDFILSHETNIIHPIDEKISFNLEYGLFYFTPLKTKNNTSISILGVGSYSYNNKTYIVSHEKSAHTSSNFMVLCYNNEVFPIYIRTRKNGDTITLSYGRKKIKDLLIDKKIPPSQRDDIVLLTNDKEVLWIPFFKMTKYQEELPNKIYIYEVAHVE